MGVSMPCLPPPARRCAGGSLARLAGARATRPHPPFAAAHPARSLDAQLPPCDECPLSLDSAAVATQPEPLPRRLTSARRRSWSARLAHPAVGVRGRQLRSASSRALYSRILLSSRILLRSLPLRIPARTSSARLLATRASPLPLLGLPRPILRLLHYQALSPRRPPVLPRSRRPESTRRPLPPQAGPRRDQARPRFSTARQAPNHPQYPPRLSAAPRHCGP
mmetsp:Transcript_57446/g.181869  ORF Transcript_57446/g.181869 Transcript_57446/m.181869 type:complete len:222 (+) Transcript_57446:2838-3503(+)